MRAKKTNKKRRKVTNLPPAPPAAAAAAPATPLALGVKSVDGENSGIMPGISGCCGLGSTLTPACDDDADTTVSEFPPMPELAAN